MSKEKMADGIVCCRRQKQFIVRMTLRRSNCDNVSDLGSLKNEPTTDVFISLHSHTAAPLITEMIITKENWKEGETGKKFMIYAFIRAKY